MVKKVLELHCVRQREANSILRYDSDRYKHIVVIFGEQHRENTAELLMSMSMSVSIYIAHKCETSNALYALVRSRRKR